MPIHTKFESWQLEQELEMPVWICVVVGAGVANRLPGVERGDAAGIEPDGTVPMWQVSQVVDDGMCEVAPTGVVVGITMIFVTPANDVFVTVGPWHETQLLVMPLWLISEPENFAPLGTGSDGTLDPVPTWQVSQATVVGMWLDGCPTMLKLAAGMANVAAALPWHCAQFEVVLGALAWMLASVGIAE